MTNLIGSLFDMYHSTRTCIRIKDFFKRGVEGQNSKINLFLDRYHSNKIKVSSLLARQK